MMLRSFLVALALATSQSIDANEKVSGTDYDRQITEISK